MLNKTGEPEAYFDGSSANVADFRTLTAQTLDRASVPFASATEQNIPVYDIGALGPVLDDPARRRALMSEWAFVLAHGSGVIALRSAYADNSVIDRATGVFRSIISEERESGSGNGDHFAVSGANDRIWNALQKQCLRDPKGFSLYFGNTAIAAACEAWLGPHYQMTAQVNQVRPGGKAQNAHRDYHLGFQTAESAAQFPVHTHMLTASLTLQGAIAHCDMPAESGPTKLLPFSQQYPPGYLAFHDAAHRAHFEDRFVQVELRKGDAMFFNPALFHAAGENRSSDIDRMANLLQVSSAFGRAMEAVDRCAMLRAAFPAFCGLRSAGSLTAGELDAAIAATAEGYSFPTNLDTDPPTGSKAPETQAAITRRAVADGWSEARFADALSALAARQVA